MASFKNLEMAAALSFNEHIEIKKSLFSQKAIYAPTSSPLYIHVAEYTPTEGEHLERLLRLPLSQLADELKAKGTPRSAAVGQYRLEAAVSSDGRFTALQLFRFNNFNYSAASDLLTAEGNDAQLLAAVIDK